MNYKLTAIKTNTPSFTVGAFLLLSLWVISATGQAGTANQIQLSDGSLIQAEIISFSNGVYKVHSEALGTLSIAEDRVQSIQPKSKATGTPMQLKATEPPVRQRVQGLEQKLTSDPETMEMLLDLTDDPSMLGVLEDKKLMRAIQQGNLNKIIQDPKIPTLMKSKAVERIIQRSQAK